jgi:peptidoglycan hydrolase CwlO-like protein
MKKALITIAIITGIVVTPILGMAITPTRDLLLGLTPDEKILTLADKIDENRSTAETKLTELQSIIDSQKSEIANYQQQVATQDAKITKAQTDIQTANTAIKTTNETVAKQKDCSADVAMYCSNEQYRTEKAFEGLVSRCGDQADRAGDSRSDAEKLCRNRYGKYFDACQKALKCE